MDTIRRLWLGLAALLTLLPMGILQGEAALEDGSWHARSAAFMGQPIIKTLVWMRVPGDTNFTVGALLLAWFMTRHWIVPMRSTVPSERAT